MTRPYLAAAAFLLACLQACSVVPTRQDASAGTADANATVLVFSRTTGFRHDSIPTAIATMRAIAGDQGLRVDATEDASVFTPQRLVGYRAVVFANTTGEVLDATQRAAFEAFVRAGGGWLGVHSAADSEYQSPWYGALAGARFAHHPPGLQTANLRFADGSGWRVTDEFYDYDHNPRADVQVIATLDERDYVGDRMGDDHPIAWCHARFGGRAWYTGLGHDIALYADARFRAHLARGLRYVTRAADDC